MKCNFSKNAFCTFILSFYSIFMHAQQWVWREIEEENDGRSPINGLIGIAFLFGIIWILSKLFDRKEEPTRLSFSDDSKLEFEENADELDYCDFSDDANICDDFSDDNLSVKIPQYHEIRSNTPNLETNDIDFTKKCIEIYGDYATMTYGLVLIKEDGEYRQIAYPDKRYEILSSYIYEHHKDRSSIVSAIGNFEILSAYIRVKENNVFPLAKPMESHGQLEKEFYGEYIIMMMAYYYMAELRFCSVSNGASPRDYCLSLGWDLSIYIHKYIKHPMEVEIFHDLKDMILRKMTKEEYIAYRSKADYISESDNKWFDGWGNHIGDTYAEAHAEFQKRKVYTYEQAIKDVKEINWNLDK